MRICIHCGTHEIGGTCVEIESHGERIVLDIGLPLDATDPDSLPLYRIPGFDSPDPSLLGVVISHPHQDHYGLAYRLPEQTPFLIGEAAQAILEAADFFTPAGLKLKHVTHLKDREPISLGPFTVTPYLVDHSAYDSYAILVEADGKRLFYSGDLRAHGRKSKLVERLIADPPQNVDVLLMEGTTLGRPETKEKSPTEDDLVPRFIELIQKTEGLTLVWASAQNIDRLVTLYKACRKTKRQLIVDVYTAQVLQATGNKNIPQAEWPDIKIFLPKSQKYRIIRDQAFELVNRLKPYRIYPEVIAAEAERSVMLFRPSMMRDLDEIEGLKIGRLICSVWKGYLDNERNKPLVDWLNSLSIPTDHCHTSGHSDTATLKRLRNSMPESTVIPVHTEHAMLFNTVFGKAQHAVDGKWLTVPTEVTDG